MREVRAFACSWGCRRNVLTSKKRMAEHEERCFHNPKNRACQTCMFLAKTTETVYDPYHGGDPGSSDYEAEIEYCEVGIGIKEQYKNNCLVWKARS